MEKKLAHRNREVLALRKAKQFCTAEMSAIVERVEALFADVVSLLRAAGHEVCWASVSEGRE